LINLVPTYATSRHKITVLIFDELENTLFTAEPPFAGGDDKQLPCRGRLAMFAAEGRQPPTLRRSSTGLPRIAKDASEHIEINYLLRDRKQRM
jgi:hypothetical protein